MISKEICDLLAISRNELKVLDLLKSGQEFQIVDIQRGTHIPRMTIYLAVNSLKKRGLASYVRKGKRRFWHAEDDAVLSEKLIGIATAYSKKKEIHVHVRDSGFTVLHGVDSVYKVWSSLLALPPKTRVHIIQPTGSIKYSLQKLPWTEKIKTLQENIRNKPIIMDSVIPEGYYDFVAEFFKNNKELRKTVFESFLGRAADVSFVSREYFKDSASELLISPEVAYLTDWKNEVSIEIKNPIMLIFLRQLYELAKGYGKRVDQNVYLKNYMSKLGD
jgi:hypothetical protein